MVDSEVQEINFKEEFENLINQVKASSEIHEFIYYASSEKVADLINEHFPGLKTVVLPKVIPPSNDGKDIVYVIPTNKPIKIPFEENKTV